MKANLLEAIILVTVAVSAGRYPKESTREKRYIYIPLNIPLPNRPAPQTQTTTAPGSAGGQPLSVADNVALSLINSFRAAHRARPVNWSTQLRDQALQCANSHAAALSLIRPICVQNGQSESNGFSINPIASQGIRSIITDPTSGWLSGYPGRAPIGSPTYWTNPTNLPGTGNYTQMIWVGHSQVGCAYSTSTAPSFSNPTYIFVCLWTPPGNVASGYAQNVLSDSL